jgi:hypothetical protein
MSLGGAHQSPFIRQNAYITCNKSLFRHEIVAKPGGSSIAIATKPARMQMFCAHKQRAQALLVI